MSIVRMKKLRLCGIADERDALLNRLQFLGSVEVSDLASALDDDDLAVLLVPDDEAVTKLRALNAKLKDALEILNKYSPKKTGLFPKKRPVSAEELFNQVMWSEAECLSNSLRNCQDAITRLHAETSRLRAVKASLEPWRSAEIPLNETCTKTTQVIFGTLPLMANIETFESALYAQAEPVQVFKIGEDRDQYYLTILCHESALESAGDVMRSFGFARASFDGYSGTAGENIAGLDRSIRIIENDILEKTDEIKSFESHRETLLVCIDRSEVEIAKEEAKTDILSTERAFLLEGWVEVPREDKLLLILKDFCCAYELLDPSPDEIEKVPVKLKNGPLAAPLSMVTEMYSLPAYDGIDPNPLIMPFFTIFFGIMYADLGYGIILMLASLIVVKKFNPEGTVGNLFKLMGECGFWAAVVGLLTGGFFGNSIITVAGMFGKEVTSLPGILNLLIHPVIDPMSDPLSVLIIAMAIGVIQIVTGMGIKAYMLIRDGHVWDAIFDVGSWWLLFAGIGVGAVTGNWYVALAGIAALILTQGRTKRGIFGKLIGGVTSLYDITSYFGDILSYSRLMTLLLAGSVIATIVNMLGSMTGNIFIFAIIFIVGHVFNMGINIIGTYVHSARLQYLEYFGKFYKEGGRPFAPLKIKTNYVSLKEEK